jgi:hypothetical protein
MNTKQKWPPASSEITALPSLPEIAPLSPPTFPTFQQLVEADRESLSAPAPTRVLNDLFDGILGTLEPLLADFQEHPEKYSQETHELLGQLTHGSKSLEQLTAHERRLLNLATLDFYSATPPKKPEPIVKQAEAEPEEDEATDELDEEAEERRASKDKGRGPIPGVDVPVTELPAYWWLG